MFKSAYIAKLKLEVIVETLLTSILPRTAFVTKAHFTTIGFNQSFSAPGKCIHCLDQRAGWPVVDIYLRHHNRLDE